MGHVMIKAPIMFSCFGIFYLSHAAYPFNIGKKPHTDVPVKTSKVSLWII